MLEMTEWIKELEQVLDGFKTEAKMNQTRSEELFNEMKNVRRKNEELENENSRLKLRFGIDELIKQNPKMQEIERVIQNWYK